MCARGLVRQTYYKLFTCWIWHGAHCHRVLNHRISQHVFKFWEDANAVQLKLSWNSKPLRTMGAGDWCQLCLIIRLIEEIILSTRIYTLAWIHVVAGYRCSRFGYYGDVETFPPIDSRVAGIMATLVSRTTQGEIVLVKLNSWMEKKVDTGTRVSCVSQGRSATLAFLFSCCTAVVFLLLRYSVYIKKKKSRHACPWNESEMH